MVMNFFKRYAQLALFLRHGAVASSMIPSAFVCSAIRDVTPPDMGLGRRRHIRHQSIVLSATDGKSGNTSKSARERGIYSRPSAAIEQGSGFFIPGLEGSRIRFLFGITVLLADAANHVLVGSQPGDWGQTVAELLSAFYGALLLLQGTVEIGAERGLAGGGDEGIMSNENEDDAIQNDAGGSSRRVSDALQGNEVASGTIQRMAQTIITFTPATYFRFVDEDLGVLYTYGVGNDKAMDINDEEQNKLTKLALDAVSESRGGRVALPSEHPASKLLPDAATRCILVQKVNGYEGSRACMVIGSDKLLPSFTKNDLRWIGQLADYSNLMGKQ